MKVKVCYLVFFSNCCTSLFAYKMEGIAPSIVDNNCNYWYISYISINDVYIMAFEIRTNQHRTVKKWNSSSYNPFGDVQLYSKYSMYIVHCTVSIVRLTKWIQYSIVTKVHLFNREEQLVWRLQFNYKVFYSNCCLKLRIRKVLNFV